MKIKTSIKKICKKCKIIYRKKKIIMICLKFKKHKQRQF